MTTKKPCRWARDEGNQGEEIVRCQTCGVHRGNTCLAPSAVVLDDERAVLEEAAVLCFEMSQKYSLETMGALQEAAGIIRTRLRKGSLKVALEYIAHVASPQPVAQTERVLTDEQRDAINTALSLIGLSGDPRVRNVHKTLRALLTAAQAASRGV